MNFNKFAKMEQNLMLSPTVISSNQAKGDSELANFEKFNLGIGGRSRKMRKTGSCVLDAARGFKF